MASPAAYTKFAQLPKEIFSIIFEFGFANGGLPFLRSICLTSRTWYDLAVTVPELWTILHVDSEECSLERLDLWIARSRSKPLSVGMYPKQTKKHWHQPFHPAFSTKVAAILLQHYHRWRRAEIDASLGDVEERAIWTEAMDGWEAMMLEEMTLKWPGEIGDLSQTSTFPRLRKLHVERAASRWAPVIIHNTVLTLTSLTINNVDASHSLHLATFLRCLRVTELLEELRMHEVTFAESTTTTESDEDPEDLFTVLPNLHTLSLTAVSETESLTHHLRLPGLIHLVLGAINHQFLSPSFLHLSRFTRGLESITTGVWQDSASGFAELALISLLTKQRRLKRLAIRDAAVGDRLVRRLTEPPPTFPFAVGNSSFVPLLENLELPLGNISSQLLVQMAKSRDRRLRYLTLAGANVSLGLVDKLSMFVREVEIDERTGSETMSSIT